jgi:hypothetical protein
MPGVSFPYCEKTTRVRISRPENDYSSGLSITTNQKAVYRHEAHTDTLQLNITVKYILSNIKPKIPLLAHGDYCSIAKRRKEISIDNSKNIWNFSPSFKIIISLLNYFSQNPKSFLQNPGFLRNSS